MIQHNSITNNLCDGSPSRPVAKKELSDYPADLRCLAKEVFSQIRSEGGEVSKFAERFHKHAREKGFCESLVDDYLCVFSRSNGYAALPKPGSQGDLSNSCISSLDASGPTRTVQESSEFPDALRELARKVFTEVQAQGLGTVVFARRMFQEGEAKGFSTDMIDRYVYDFNKRLGIKEIDTPPKVMPALTLTPDGEKTLPGPYPAALRDLARKIFLQVQAEGGGTVVFGGRMLREGRKAGFKGVMIDNYVYDFNKRLGIKEVTPTKKMPARTALTPEGEKKLEGPYPDALRELARKIFTEVQSEGGGVVVFGRRMLEQGRAKGFDGKLISRYVYDFNKRLGIRELSEPAKKWQPQLPSFDVEATDTEEKSAANRRVEAVNKACKAAVYEDPERSGDAVNKRARELLQDSEWAYLTKNELMFVLTSIGEVPIDTHMEIKRRLASLRKLAKRLRLSSSDAIPHPKEVIKLERVQSKIADLEDRLTKGNYRPPEASERVAIAKAKLKKSMRAHKTLINKLHALEEKMNHYVVSENKKSDEE